MADPVDGRNTFEMIVPAGARQLLAGSTRKIAGPEKPARLAALEFAHVQLVEQD